MRFIIWCDTLPGGGTSTGGDPWNGRLHKAVLDRVQVRETEGTKQTKASKAATSKRRTFDQEREPR